MTGVQTCALPISLHVSGAHFWQFVVAAGNAELSQIAKEPGDAACKELLKVHRDVAGEGGDEEKFYARMIEDQRVVIRFTWERVTGVYLADPPPGV